MTKLQFKATRNTVTANAYVPHVMYKSNEAIVEKLGGTIVKGAGLFTAEFPSAAKAKAFVEQAVTSISKREYNASRKSEPKVAEKPAVAKGKGKSQKQAVTKGKGSTKATDDIITYNGKQYTLKATSDGLVMVPVAKAKVAKGKGTAAKKVEPKAQPKAAKKVTKGKGNGKAVDFSKLAGKGTSANKQAAKLIRAAGITDGKSKEYQALWQQWCEVR